jgi:hypothetical protein
MTPKKACTIAHWNWSHLLHSYMQVKDVLHISIHSRHPSRQSTKASHPAQVYQSWYCQKPGKMKSVMLKLSGIPSRSLHQQNPRSVDGLFELWFNVYRRFFTFVVGFNLIGIILAATGHFKYAENHLGALVLGNLLMAILMRNELFVRFLYLLAIYGLRSVSSSKLLVGQ